MTIAEIAAQMDTAQATVLVLSALAVVCGLAVLIARFIGSDNISAALVILSVLLWDEMCAIKDMFFGEDERVMQFHPPKSEYINNYPYCLHLWKPVDTEIPHPPMICV